MVGSLKGIHLAAQVAGYLPACLEEELCLAQLESVIIRYLNAVIAAYLYQAELPYLAERCPRGSPQRMEDGHNQAHLECRLAI